MGQHPGTKSPAAVRRLRRCARYALYSILAPSAQHNGYGKRARCQWNTTECFDSQGTQPQLQKSPKRLFSHSNKEQLQPSTDRSTNKATKQDVSQENWLYRNYVRSRPTPSMYPFSKHGPNQRSSLQRAQQTKNETLRTARFKYPHESTLERASALFKRTFTPIFL